MKIRILIVARLLASSRKLASSSLRGFDPFQNSVNVAGNSMTKFLWINVMLALFISAATHADEKRESWDKKSFEIALKDFLKKDEKITRYDVLAWYVMNTEKRLTGENAAVLVEATNSKKAITYYVAILYLSHRKSQSREWQLVWIFDDKNPPKFRRFTEIPNNENIYSLFADARWNWGCDNPRLEIEGKVRDKIWEERIGQKPTKDFVGNKADCKKQ